MFRGDSSSKMSKNSARSMQCHQFQEQMAKKREREFRHQQKWDNQVEYYKKFDKVNNKFENWTSPRYYEANSEMIKRLQEDRNKKENLERRREKLKRLFAEDEASYEVEAMMKKAQSLAKSRTKFDDIPTEVLKDMNVGLKIEEDEKKRREAELKLYHQWRNNNPMVRQAERNKSTREIKLSWLDQQIEKRMSKEKEEEECRKILKERDKNILEAKQKEQVLAEESETKNRQLKEDLLKQMDEIKQKQKQTDELKKEEQEDVKKQQELFELQEKLRAQETLKKNKEIALFNLKQHKLKLKKMAKHIEEDLQDEQNLVTQLLQLKVTDRIRNELTKQEVKRALDEFLAFTREQKMLEKKRQDYMDCLFDSETKLAYEKQKEIWDGEGRSRKNLLKDVLRTIDAQIDENIKTNQEKQKALIAEREHMILELENYETELENSKKFEMQKKETFRKEIDKQLADKRLKEKRLKELERKNYDAELESMKEEEKRLQKEIIKIQNTHAPLRYARKKPWY